MLLVRGTTPQRISDDCRLFCDELVKGQKPFYLPITPLAWALPKNCGLNVAVYCRANGGLPLVGFAIWQYKKDFIEAEWHVVWQSENGELRDITPQPHKEQTILFLPKPGEQWGRIEDNVFINEYRPCPLRILRDSIASTAIQKTNAANNAIGIGTLCKRTLFEPDRT